ncbi:MAG: T9SS type A sorting domain-containing protein, partial [Candidatus Cloacimonadaceae bacterium]
PDEGIRTWAIRVKSDRINIPLLFSVDDSFGRFTEKLYLRDNSTAYMHDLETGPYTFQVPDTNYKGFTLYWGNLQPTVSIVSLPNRIYQGGAAQIFNFSANYNSLISHFDVSIQTETDSILVAENLPNTTTNYNYIFPTDVQMQKARLVVDGWANDGQRIRTYSAYQFSIIPLNLTYNPAPGLMMQANVWPNSSPMAETVFGPNTLAWTMDSNSNWWMITPFSFGLGYFIDKDNIFEYTSTNPIQRDSLSFNIRSGWNIIPNPHMCTYNVKDLKFRLYGIYYSFAEMLDQNLVSSGVYVYRNNEYILTDTIYAQESFLLKYYGSTHLIAAINFAPYNNGPEIRPINPLWQLRLTASQDDCDTDDFVVGSNSRSSDGYDFKYDLPEPPSKPLPNLARLYLTRSPGDPGFPDLQLHTEFRAPFGITEDEEQVFNFTLEAGNTNPMQLDFDIDNLPDGYGVGIHIGNVQYDIQHGNELIYQPVQAGPIIGQLFVRNYFTSNQDETMPALTGLKVYPNPFNPETAISFIISKSEQVKVDIYNIKGQHVRTLHEGLIKSGRQKLVWNGKDDKGKGTGSGLYFARVKTSDKTHVIKMMLLK